MTVIYQPRKFGNEIEQMPTVGGLDRFEITNKLLDLSDQMWKLKLKQESLLAMLKQLDRHAEMLEWEEKVKNSDSMFDAMFGGE